MNTTTTNYAHNDTIRKKSHCHHCLKYISSNDEAVIEIISGHHALMGKASYPHPSTDVYGLMPLLTHLTCGPHVGYNIYVDRVKPVRYTKPGDDSLGDWLRHLREKNWWERAVEPIIMRLLKEVKPEFGDFEFLTPADIDELPGHHWACGCSYHFENDGYPITYACPDHAQLCITCAVPIAARLIPYGIDPSTIDPSITTCPCCGTNL